MTSETAARRISAFGQHLRSMVLPANIREMAKLHLLDAIGVALAAASLNTRPRIEDAIAILGAAQDATGLGLASPIPAPSAALLNGSLVHALEFDDTHMGAVVHASAVVMPTALAIAEREQRSGEDVLKAFTLGWELLARAGQASPGGFHARGFPRHRRAWCAGRSGGCRVADATRWTSEWSTRWESPAVRQAESSNSSVMARQ